MAKGLIRLGLSERIAERLDPAEFLPACGQGALAVEIRKDDERVAELVKPLDDPESRATTAAERAFLAALGGGCSLPVGGLASLEGDLIRLQGVVAAPDGSRVLRVSASGKDPQTLGKTLAKRALADGANELLRPEGIAE